MAKSFSFPHSSMEDYRASSSAGDEWTVIRRTLLEWKFWLRVIVIVVAGLWIYWPALRGAWLWDDDTLITDNHLVHDPWGLFKIWFRPGEMFDFTPVTVMVEWIEWHLWGNETCGYHLLNLTLHLTSAFLVWRLLARFGLKFAWLGGLIFVVHPVMVESVAWIAELKNTLSLPPLLVAMFAYMDFEESRRWKDYGRALLFFLLAMLCKATMVMFPVVILLYAWWRRGKVRLGDLKASAPFFVISVVIGLITIWFLQHHALFREAPNLGGFLSRFACAGLAISFYFTKCIQPIGLMPIYPQWDVDPPAIVQLLPWSIMAGILIWLWARRSGWGRHALLGVGFFLINLLPFVGFTGASYMFFTWVMDHLLYIPLIGLIGLFVAGCEQLHSRLSSAPRCLGIGILSVVLALFTWGSRSYAEIYVNPETLWSYELRVNPRAWPAYNNLGAIFLKRNRVPDALPLFDEALKLNPDYMEAHYNRALALEGLNRGDEAVNELENVLHLSPERVVIRFMLARGLSRLGRNPEAIEQYRIGLQRHPEMFVARAEMGNLLTQTGRFPEAADAFSQVIADCPTAASPHNSLGNVLYVMGYHDAAIEEYRKAIKLDPEGAEGHNNFGGALQHTGHLVEAIKEFQVALSLDSTNPNLHINLARALAQGGQKEEAIKEYQAALRFDANSVEANSELAALQGSRAPKSPKK